MWVDIDSRPPLFLLPGPACRRDSARHGTGTEALGTPAIAELRHNDGSVRRSIATYCSAGACRVAARKVRMPTERMLRWAAGAAGVGATVTDIRALHGDFGPWLLTIEHSG